MDKDSAVKAIVLCMFLYMGHNISPHFCSLIGNSSDRGQSVNHFGFPALCYGVIMSASHQYVINHLTGLLISEVMFAT